MLALALENAHPAGQVLVVITTHSVPLSQLPAWHVMQVSLDVQLAQLAGHLRQIAALRPPFTW